MADGQYLAGPAKDDFLVRYKPGKADRVELRPFVSSFRTLALPKPAVYFSTGVRGIDGTGMRETVRSLRADLMLSGLSSRPFRTAVPRGLSDSSRFVEASDGLDCWLSKSLRSECRHVAQTCQVALTPLDRCSCQL